MNVTCSDEESDWSKEDDSNFVASASKSIFTDIIESGADFSLGVSRGVSSSIQSSTHQSVYESNDDWRLNERRSSWRL